ncbi:MAG: PilN domain-containing protein [Planctomycetes bacterium]|nr:PilN domain-containing protein [Planctomycetota bacterium]
MRTIINLLPASYRRQQILRRRAIQWGSVVCAVLLVGWCWHRYERREELALSQQLESLAREHAPTRVMLKQLVNMRHQLDELQQQESVVRELEYQRNALTLLGVLSQTAQAAKGRLRVTKVELAGFQNMRRAEPNAAAQSAPADGLTVRGVSLDNPAVAELLDGLQDSGMFSRVELLESKEREESEVSLRDYKVRCEF